MKRLLTTAMVLVMLVTMFCASPVATAAGNPAMELKAIYRADPSSDNISAKLTDVADATWVVWSVKSDSTGEYVFVGEKRGNKAEAEGFDFDVATAEKTGFAATTDFTAEAKISYSNGTVKTLSEPIAYKTYTEVQAIIRGMLADPQVYTIVEATDELTIPRPAYYSATEDAAILASLRSTYAAAIADPTLDIAPETFMNNLINAMLVAALNSNNASTISTVLDKYYTNVGLAINTTEKMWYDASATKDFVLTKLASFTYGSVPDFTNQFKTIAFLDRLAFEPLANVMNFLSTNNNIYHNYGTNIHLNGGSSVTNLTFGPGGYDVVALAESQQEVSASFMAGRYESLNALEAKFAQLLLKLAAVGNPSDPNYDSAFEAPSAPQYTPPASPGSSGPTVSVGLQTPIVGETVVNPFTDIDGVEWAKEAIIALAKEGVIEGVSARQYQPDANVTREQFVKIIVNTFGLKGTGTVAAFEDVDQNEWYASYINTAVELGIIKGVSDSAFGVGQNISRQDMTLIMYRVANFVGIDVSAKSGRTFTDADSIDGYAIDAVTALYRAGIVNGVADGVFGGQQTATRAQAAKLCYDLRESK